jgi:NhaP-type Na+/H+ or K+/H+ antiporter/CRP-like cAMP-binding protein
MFAIMASILFYSLSLWADNSNGTMAVSEVQPVHQNEGGHGADMSPLFFITVSLFIGVAVRNLLRKSPLPFTVALLIIGALIAIPIRMNYLDASGVFHKAVEWAGHIDPHIIMYVFLPTLIFEAAFALDVHTFRKSFTNAAILAAPGLIIGLIFMAFLAMGIMFTGIGLLEWDWVYALIFGTIAMATDPVAVVALLKELGASKKLSTLVESESMLNDGTAIVVFMVLIGIITGTSDGNIGMATLEFVRVAVGGTLIGLIIGWLVSEWLKRVFNDPLFEITIIVAAAYLTFFVAEHFFHVSGVLGLVALGLLMAGVGRTRISPEVNHFLHEFWELAAFIANTLIFIIVGVVIVLRTVFTPMDVVILLIAYVGITVARAGMIAMFFPLMKKIGYGMSKNDAIVLWWGGLRGAVGLALALIVASQEEIPLDIRNQILFLTAGIVILTSLINATTTKTVVRLLGMTKISSAKASLLTGNSKNIRQSAENTLNKIKNDRYMKGADWDIVKTYLPNEISFDEKDVVQVDSIAEVRKQILQKEKYSYWKQFEEGLLGRDAVQELSDTVSVLMDDEGKVSLSARKDMEYLWRTSKTLNLLQNIPLVKNYTKHLFFNRLANSYDCARGFVVAQDDMLKLLKSLALNVDDDSTKLSVEDLELLENEIYENRIQGLTFIRNLKEAFPEVYRSIETKQAIRTILNHQRSMVEKLVTQKRMEYDEAKKINEEIEERMHSIMDKPLKSETSVSKELFSDIFWLKDIPDAAMQKVIDQMQQKVYSIGETIIKHKKLNSDIYIIRRGTAKIMIDGKTEDIVGPGSILGEMSIIKNVGRDATVEAELPVTAFKLPAPAITKLMHEIPTLGYNLWLTGARRFAEELLQFEPKFREVSQNELRTFISKGTLLNTQSGQTVKTLNKYCFLLSGKIKDKNSSDDLSEPTLIKFEEAICQTDAKFLIIEKE